MAGEPPPHGRRAQPPTHGQFVSRKDRCGSAIERGMLRRRLRKPMHERLSGGRFKNGRCGPVRAVADFWVRQHVPDLTSFTNAF